MRYQVIVRQDSMPPHDISERQEVLNNAAASLAGKDDPILRARRALSERLTNQSATFLKKKQLRNKSARKYYQNPSKYQVQF